MKHKKAQLTAVIIVVVVLLIIAGLFISFRLSEEVSFEERAAGIIGDVAVEAEPVKNFVEACLNQVAEDGLRKIGNNGGFLDTSQFSVNLLNPTEGNAVALDSQGKVAVPYWFHMSSKNNCEKTGGCSFATQRPNLFKSEGEPSIEGQLDRYINQNLEACLQNFNAFKEAAIDVSIDGRPSADTSIDKDGVNILLSMPLAIKAPDKTTEIKGFFTSTPLRIFDMYSLATEITNLQVEHNYFEKHAFNMVVLFSEVDTTRLPPIGDMEFKLGGGKVWVRSRVANQIKDFVLAPYIPMLQTFGTANYKPVEVSTGASPETRNIIYNRGMLIPLNNTYPDLTSGFSYLPKWNPYFDLNCNGEVCQSEDATFAFLTFLGVQRYQFAYDLSFPVLVELNQPLAFEGSGFSFKIMLEANLRNNEPLTPTFKPLQTVPPNEFNKESLFCDPLQRTSPAVTISVKDGVTDEPVEDMLITYVCGREVCNMGNTNVNGQLRTPFPTCLGGFIEGLHQEYAQTKVDFDSLSDEQQTLDLEANPFQFVDVSVKKIPLRKSRKLGSWRVDLDNPLIEMSSKEEAIIMMTKITEPGEQPFAAFANIIGNKFTKTNPCHDSPKQDNAKDIKFGPGTYEVNVLMMNYDEVIIPEDTRTTGGDSLFSFDADYTIPEIRFNCTQPLPSGQAIFNWTVTGEELEDAKEIEFRVINVELAKMPESIRAIEDLEQLGRLAEYSGAARSALFPTILK